MIISLPCTEEEFKQTKSGKVLRPGAISSRVQNLSLKQKSRKMKLIQKEAKLTPKRRFKATKGLQNKGAAVQKRTLTVKHQTLMS